ncbi:hypothetical protein Kpho02_44410 [Kitasatospora phosalacinea]|uniref:Uncharacterized protein n=1 Tax=Kitasatospora phosalacinea TaxID=2065 RepID=A0A9W6Q8Q1_9ACTN|nr:hypothetical protein [Kitasatospora phosalacinea]GLW72142.1 hypothetical protein Kpho02_44410 [Kitasatospora phosalacinea]
MSSEPANGPGTHFWATLLLQVHSWTRVPLPLQVHIWALVPSAVPALLMSRHMFLPSAPRTPETSAARVGATRLAVGVQLASKVSRKEPIAPVMSLRTHRVGVPPTEVAPLPVPAVTASKATGEAKSKTWVGAVNKLTGEVAVTCSGRGTAPSRISWSAPAGPGTRSCSPGP